MAKKRVEIDFYSFGIYEPWERESKEIPKLKKITTEIPVEPGIEFGYVLKIKKAKGKKITFIMHHPPFLDESGEVAPSFEGEEYINSNDWSFFLGDTVWAPYESKAGEWELITLIDGKVIASKKFNLIWESTDN